MIKLFRTISGLIVHKLFVSIIVLFLFGIASGSSSFKNNIEGDNLSPQNRLSSSLGQSEGACPQYRYTRSVSHMIYHKNNPLESTPENIAIGEVLYHHHKAPLACKDCHGEKGNGQGDKWAGLDFPPRNFSCGITMKSIPDGQLFGIIKYGSPGTKMLAYDSLEDEQIWQLVVYIRQFAK